MTHLREYLQQLRLDHQTGNKETSSYGALQQLFNEVGKTLSPKVRCTIHPKNKGAGIPDGGFFTSDQYRDADDNTIFAKQSPARGVIEVKSTSEDVETIAQSAQVKKYLGTYGVVLVTNYRDFLLVGRDHQGQMEQRERYTLEADEKTFWTTPVDKIMREHQTQLTEYLKRVMLHSAPLTSPEDLAFFLASYARDALARVEKTKNLQALTVLRKAMEKALGITFSDDKGERFFRSTLVQTIFYGIFSAWVLWSKKAQSNKTFNWHDTEWLLNVPVIEELFGRLSRPAQLRPLGLEGVLDWTEAALNRVERTAFFERFEEDHAVQYFYEPFLEAFDPVLRKDLGVWYTPPEIVNYMVERIDTTLRQELGIPDGLAANNVYILDPCCGTGAYLVEVAKRLEKTLREHGDDAFVAHDVKRALMERVYGFEILAAPFVVAHLQLGLMMQRLGVPLNNNQERVSIYLTNALTGWDKNKAEQLSLPEFPQLRRESEAATQVKQEKPILVILGNPPYNAFAGTSPKEEEGLVEPYKKGLSEDWGIKKYNLDDLYIRFFRLAERRIAEMSGQGIVCYISNFSYLRNASFVVMRQRFLSEFDQLWFDSLNGDSRKTGKLTPEGLPDPSVFSTAYNKAGIRVGTAIGMLVRTPNRQATPTVHYREFWGVSKRLDLLASLLQSDLVSTYTQVKTQKDNRFSFKPRQVAPHYMEWPSVIDLCTIPPINGPVERRGSTLIVHKANAELLDKLSAYLDPSVSDDDISSLCPRWMESSGEFSAKDARTKLKGKVVFDRAKIMPYYFKPFDERLTYLDENIAPLFSRPSPNLLKQRQIEGNRFFITRDSADKDEEGSPFFFSPNICDYDSLSGHTRHFPIWVYRAQPKKPVNQIDLFVQNDNPIANLSSETRSYLSGLGFSDADIDGTFAETIWLHSLAIGYTTNYLSENEDGIQENWPRIPLPTNRDELLASARLGQQIAALLDIDTQLIGITSGSIRAELRSIGVVQHSDGRQIVEQIDLDVTGDWGHPAGRSVQPGGGNAFERDYTEDELHAFENGGIALGMSLDEMQTLLGETTYDIYLNTQVYWRNVPARIWDYTIGGYQVIKKWLSYRDKSVLQRGITVDEVREVISMARRLAALALLETTLNRNYSAIKDTAYPWKG